MQSVQSFNSWTVRVPLLITSDELSGKCYIKTGWTNYNFVNLHHLVDLSFTTQTTYKAMFHSLNVFRIKWIDLSYYIKNFFNISKFFRIYQVLNKDLPAIFDLTGLKKSLQMYYMKLLYKWIVIRFTIHVLKTCERRYFFLKLICFLRLFCLALPLPF
jgi:hypothetical protein